MTTFTKAAFIAVFLCLFSGCSTIETLGDYVADNPLVAQIATRQAVAQYIAEGETIEDEIERARHVQKRIQKVMLYLDGEPKARVDELMAVIDGSIDWEELTFADRMLVQEIVNLVEVELSKAEQPVIPESTKIVLRTLFETAISAASLYAYR